MMTHVVLLWGVYVNVAVRYFLYQILSLVQIVGHSIENIINLYIIRSLLLLGLSIFSQRDVLRVGAIRYLLCLYNL